MSMQELPPEQQAIMPSIPPQKGGGFQVITAIDLMDLLKSTFLPEDIKQQLWALVSQITTLSFLDEVNYERLFWKTKYIITLAKAWMDFEKEKYDDNTYRDTIMKLEQLEYLVILQLRRSVQGFWSKLIAGVYEGQDQRKRGGLLHRLFG